MRILIITAQYAPSMTPNVYRWSAIAKYWVSQGHQVHILCTRHSAAPNDQMDQGVWVHRAGENSLLDWIYNWLGKKERRAEAGAKTKASRKRKWLEKLVDLTWRSFYWPDGRCLWYRPGKKRAAELIHEFRIEGIISVGLPFTAHRIAQATKHSHPRLRWLMDIEDPFSVDKKSRINNRFLYARLNHWAEGRALQLADSISVTVDAAKTLYEKAFPYIGSKISIVPPLYSLSPQPAAAYRFEPPDKIHLAYFGAFYHHVRSPDNWLALLEATRLLYPELASQLRVHFYGEIHPAFLPAFERYPNLKSMVQLHGLVPRETVAAATQAVDFLVNISNRTSFHLPSKSVDYLMSGKPIINISSQPEDTFRRFMQTYPLLLDLLLPDNQVLPEQVQDFVHFLQTHSGVSVPQELLQQLMEPYTLERVAERYLEIL